MIVILKYLIPNSYSGLAIYPFIFLKERKLEENKPLLNHERIHLQQQKELLWVFFFVWYFIEFIILLLKFKNRNKAYKNISFEKEAYKNEENLLYLNQRKFYSFLKYL
ncbi:hypothetical protein [Lutibacter sp.]|uniref:hypothetical protein n=1 Tax=Lutibacter sp. TaxID=1925666 RepID=UPI0027331492|nr:hypothetical protein [Lutibacter sp.]MDP3312952.1 hypothetical protein [Lutibacter sp.]